MFKALVNEIETQLDSGSFLMAVEGVKCAQNYGLVEVLKECKENKNLFYNLLTRYFIAKAELTNRGFVFYKY